MAQTALLVIDMQMGMARRIAEGRTPSNPAAPDQIARLIALFRERGQPVVHIHHDDPDPAAPFRRGTPDGEPMPCALPLEGEAVIWKAGSSAFSGTGLDALLRRMGVSRVVVCGAVAAFCVTSSVRSASDAGFEVILPTDALLGFDLPAHDGGRIDADTIMRVTLATLGADFAELSTVEALAAAP